MKKRKQRGLTLVEIMVVITIIGLIMSVVAVSVMERLKEAQVKTARIDIAQISSALELYMAQKGRYPDPTGGLNVLVAAKVLKELHDDPWDHPYVYTLMPDGERLVQSYGADGAPGGEEFATDLSSRDPKK